MTLILDFCVPLRAQPRSDSLRSPLVDPRANEALEVMTRLWSEENVSFEGEFIQVSEATLSPRPVQQPLPLWIGGASPAAIRRTVRYGTGWLAGLQDVEGAVATAKAIREENRAQNGSVAPDHYGATVLYRIETPGEAEKKSKETKSPLKGAAKLISPDASDAPPARGAEYPGTQSYSYVLYVTSA